MCASKVSTVLAWLRTTVKPLGHSYFLWDRQGFLERTPSLISQQLPSLLPSTPKPKSQISWNVFIESFWWGLVGGGGQKIPKFFVPQVHVKEPKAVYLGGGGDTAVEKFHKKFHWHKELTGLGSAALLQLAFLKEYNSDCSRAKCPVHWVKKSMLNATIYHRRPLPWWEGRSFWATLGKC